MDKPGDLVTAGDAPNTSGGGFDPPNTEGMTKSQTVAFAWGIIDRAEGKLSVNPRFPQGTCERKAWKAGYNFKAFPDANVLAEFQDREAKRPEEPTTGTVVQPGTLSQIVPAAPKGSDSDANAARKATMSAGTGSEPQKAQQKPGKAAPSKAQKGRNR